MEREYTCPMDPEVRQKGPGACPKCGMALEPVDVAPRHKGRVDMPDAPGDRAGCARAHARSAAWRSSRATVTLEEKNPELDDMTRRFRWSLCDDRADSRVHGLGVPARSATADNAAARLAELDSVALATPVVLWGGWPFFVRGWASVVNRHLNMFTLIALGVGAAYAFSVVATIAPGLFPDSFRMNGSVAVYFEPAAVIVVLVLLGQVLELRARSRTGAAIRNLLGLAPKTARRIGEDGTEQDVPLEHVRRRRSTARPPG